ncbi:hypothetical protein BGX34_000450 [Mortierella sp. NVP85]|nr:hypothetical protein BGX34_000450 [Mortierella sp. NVP85]
MTETTNESILVDDSQDVIATVMELMESPSQMSTVVELVSEPTQEESSCPCDRVQSKEPLVPQGTTIIDMLHRMYPSSTARWNQPRSFPGQVTCIRSGCSYPINVDKVRNIRHPFCSIECARACGENPRVLPAVSPPPVPVPVSVPVSLKAAASPSSNGVAQEVTAGCLNFKRLVGKAKREVTSYPSPPMTEDSFSTDDDEETLAEKK